MLLKDKLKKVFKNNKNTNDKIKLPLADGFVDIKGYKDGKLIYHDCGDNVVTDWMRQAIITMLAGVSFTKYGDCPKYNGEGKRGDSTDTGYDYKNPDGYLFNGQQYGATIDKNDQCKYVSPLVIGGDQAPLNDKAVFPTKILFGTGKEYRNWATLQSENETTHASWYNEMVNLYGGGDLAEQNFNSWIENPDSPPGYDPAPANYNDFSGTIADGVHSGDGLLAKCRTVNDPDISTTEVASAVSMYRNYGVIGAIKTPYTRITGNDYPSGMLQEVISESGKLLRAKYRGVGQPAFIYFNQHLNNSTSENWGDPAAEVYISKDPADKYLTKITFTINLPEQTAATKSSGAYYPYNGFTLKQIGLYNDSQVIITSDSQGQQVPEPSDGAWFPYSNMQHGTLLAVKNIAPFTKQAGSNYVISWTLTI